MLFKSSNFRSSRFTRTAIRFLQRSYVFWIHSGWTHRHLMISPMVIRPVHPKDACLHISWLCTLQKSMMKFNQSSFWFRFIINFPNCLNQQINIYLCRQTRLMQREALANKLWYIHPRSNLPHSMLGRRTILGINTCVWNYRITNCVRHFAFVWSSLM